MVGSDDCSRLRAFVEAWTVREGLTPLPMTTRNRQWRR